MELPPDDLLPSSLTYSAQWLTILLLVTLWMKFIKRSPPQPPMAIDDHELLAKRKRALLLLALKTLLRFAVSNIVLVLTINNLCIWAGYLIPLVDKMFYILIAKIIFEYYHLLDSHACYAYGELTAIYVLLSFPYQMLLSVFYGLCLSPSVYNWYVLNMAANVRHCHLAIHLGFTFLLFWAVL